jgi:molybdenum cofactor sulfurtransferase
MARAHDKASPEQDSAFRSFLGEYPEYAETRRLDDLRGAEYARLDRDGHVYLDYTGGSLYAESQVREHAAQLCRNVYGNPHSNNPTSQAMTDGVERARAHVLEYFGAPPDEYFAIFTPNASGALKHAGESYPFTAGGRFLLPFDNHNSVNGIREFARARGAAITYAPLTSPELRIDRPRLDAALREARRGAGNLFAFPAQSNFSGVQHPLELIDEAHAAGWDVLLDAAAFVPTNRLDLGRWKPDLVALSFYKMFGYPTGVGCLLMRKSIFARLERPWFAGGTILIASVQGDAFYRAPDQAAYEDGTVDYLSIPAVEIGLRHLASLGVDLVHERVRCLTGSLVRIHGPTALGGRGGTISLNLFDPEGAGLDIRRVEELANEEMISLRTGCFCNPGAGEAAYGLSPEQIGQYFRDQEGLTFDELRSRIRDSYGIEVGAIRVSVGLATNFADVHRFVRFLRGFLDRSAAEVGRAKACPAHAARLRDTA